MLESPGEFYHRSESEEAVTLYCSSDNCSASEEGTMHDTARTSNLEACKCVEFCSGVCRVVVAGAVQ